MSKKYKDRNGFLHLEGTPISRVQVAPYLGKQIDASGNAGLEPDKIYFVYRGPNELFKEETMKSFEGMPFRVGHQMLGKGGGKVKSVDSTPIDGCFFNVRRSEEKPDYLIADIVIYTEKALRAIANGTKELSLGYRCAYVPCDGEHEGERYQFKQTNITANHLALVPHGRAGSSVCVQDEAIVTNDGLVVTCDSLPEEIQIMEENEKKAKDKLTELLKSSEKNVQDCLDYCDLSDEQKAAVKAMKSEKKDDEPKADKPEATAEDEKKVCKGCGKDELPPPPPPPAEEEKKEDEPAPANEEPKAEPEPEKTVEKTETVVETNPAPVTEEPKTEPVPEKPVEDAEPKCPTCGKTFTEDELNEACAKAAKAARKDAIRAKALADAVGEDADDCCTEADVARKACKKIKGLEQYASDEKPDGEVLAAIRGHLARQVAEEDKDKKDEPKDEDPKATPKKKILTVAQDEGIAKTPKAFSMAGLTKFLAEH